MVDNSNYNDTFPILWNKFNKKEQKNAPKTRSSNTRLVNRIPRQFLSKLYRENCRRNPSGLEKFPANRFPFDFSDVKIVIVSTLRPIRSLRPSSSKSFDIRSAFDSFKMWMILLLFQIYFYLCILLLKSQKISPEKMLNWFLSLNNRSK